MASRGLQESNLEQIADTLHDESDCHPGLLSSRAEWVHCCMKKRSSKCAVLEDERASKGPHTEKVLMNNVKYVQVLGLVKDVQAKSGKLYKDWLKCAFHP